MLDDDYTLYENGEVLHEYDANIYPRGLNKSTTLLAHQLKPEVKQRLLEAANAENIDLVRKLLKL